MMAATEHCDAAGARFAFATNPSRCVATYKGSMISIEKTEITEQLWELLLLADPSKEEVQKYLPYSEVFVAKLDNKVVGLLALNKLSEGASEIKNIAVYPAHQRLGIGRELLTHVISNLRNRNQIGHEIRICTCSTSVRQLSLYKKTGFKLIRVEKGYFLKNYPEPIFENGARCEDLMILAQVVS